MSKVKELLQCFIGLVHHVSLQWLLDTDRGADYFIRWHRNREMSGSFMNNEATYHFDLLNWGIVEVPETVYGAREPFFMQLAVASTGYMVPTIMLLRSSVILILMFFCTGISIEGNMTVEVKYRNGIHLSYSRVSYSPVEGFVVTFHSDRGRLPYEKVNRKRIRIDNYG